MKSDRNTLRVGLTRRRRDREKAGHGSGREARPSKEQGDATWLISQLAYGARSVVQLPATKLPDRRRRVPSNLPAGPDSWRRAVNDSVTSDRK